MGFEMGGVENSLGEIRRQMEAFTSMLGKSVSEMNNQMNPLAKQVSKSKFQKGTSKLGSMFKSIAGASPQAFALEKIISTLQPLLGLFEPFQVFLDIITGLLEAMVGQALKPMFEVMQPLYDLMLSLMPTFQRLGTALGELISVALQPLIAVFELLFPLLEPILNILITIITAALEPLRDILGPLSPMLEDLSPLFQEIGKAIEAASPYIAALVGFLGDVFKGFFNIKGLLDTLATFLGSVFEGAWNGIKTAMENVKNFIVNVFKGVWNTLKTVMENVKNFVVGGFKNAWNNIKNALAGIFEGIRGFINTIINGLNDLDVLDLIPDIPTIPALATGGTFIGPKIVGEAGAEEVVPLERESVVLDALDEILYETQKERLLIERLVQSSERNRGVKRGRYG